MADARAKKVAILLPSLGGGGAEQVAVASAKDLASKDHQVDLLLVEARGELLPLVPESVRVIDLKADRIIAALPPLFRYLREDGPDTLHAHMWPLPLVPILASMLARSYARIVVSEHTSLSRHIRSGPQRLLLRWSTRIFY